MPDLSNKLESILFVSNKPLTAKALARLLEIDELDVKRALAELALQRKDSGVVLLEADEGFQLASNSANSTAVKNFLNADLRERLTDASVEVLAIIAYRQPVSRSEIEAIRGVNSQYSIRALLIRGLVEKIPNPDDARANLYQVTTEFLQHMGLTAIADLPEFNQLTSQVKLPEVPQTAPEALPADLPTDTRETDGLRQAESP